MIVYNVREIDREWGVWDNKTKHNNMGTRKVVITGMGVVSPIGIELDSFLQGNLAGKSAPSLIKHFDASQHKIKFAAEIPNFDASLYIPKQSLPRTDRFTHFGVAAAKMAIDDSGINLTKEDVDRIGICMGSGLGGILFHEEEMTAMLHRKTMESHPFTVPKVSANAVASWLAILLKIGGPNISITSACSSSAHAIGQAFDMIRMNRVDTMITGGAEAPITPFTFGAFSSIGVMSQRNESPEHASRPFDKNRDGFVMGEGSGVIILEELEHAKKRGAKIYAELIGYGLSNGTYHMIIPQPDGKDVERAMINAIKDASISCDDIDYINAHGTSTQANDKIETIAIKNVFKSSAKNIPVSSTKSMIGHLIGAAGAVEMIASVLSLTNNILFPTINYETPDPECDLDYVPNKAREKRITTVMSNSFGFGGNNASLIIRKYL